MIMKASYKLSNNDPKIVLDLNWMLLFFDNLLTMVVTDLIFALYAVIKRLHFFLFPFLGNLGYEYLIFISSFEFV